jgi:BAG domain
MQEVNHDFSAQIKEYEQDVGRFMSSRQQDPRVKKKLQDTGAYLSEKLMQALFALDGIQCQPGFHTARQKRKESVNFAQELHDRIDQIKGLLKTASL